MVHDAIIESQIGQTYHANKKKGIMPKFEVGDLVYLSTKNPDGKAPKLSFWSGETWVTRCRSHMLTARSWRLWIDILNYKGQHQ